MLLFFSSFSFPVFSGSPDPVDTLDRVVVNATRSDYGFVSTPGMISVITQADIQASGAIHLVDVLRTVGGIQVSDLFGDGTDASVGLRGFSETAQQNTLIMIDGRRLNNADNGVPDLNTVALRNIERIEIIKGSAGTLYGDKAVGGIINIITHRPEELQVQVETGVGSYNRRSIFTNIENRHENGIGYRFSAERRLSNNYRNNNDVQLTNIAGKLTFEHETGELFAELEDVNEDVELPGPLFRDQVAANRRQALNPGDFVNTDTRAARLGFSQALTGNIEAQFEYTNRLSETDGRLSSAGFASPLFLKRHHIEYTPRLIGTFDLPTGRSLLTIGADIFKTDYFLRSDFGLTIDTQEQYSAYGRAIVPLSSAIDMTAGGRYGKVKNDILVDTLCCGRSLPPGTEIDDSAYAFEFGLSYQFKPSLRLFGKVDRNYRFVTADEYSAIADNNFFGAPFLPFPETQTGYSYEIGADWQHGNKSLQVLLYQLDLHDEIVFDPSAGANTGIGDTRRRGIIIEGDYVLNRQWRFSANYSLLDTEVTSGPFSGADLTFLADHTAHLAAHYRMTEHLQAYLALNGTSSRVFTGDFNNDFSRLPGYVVADMNLAYQRRNFKIAFHINNLLDREYSDSGSIGFDFRQGFPSPRVGTFFPSPERNFFFTFSYNYP